MVTEVTVYVGCVLALILGAVAFARLRRIGEQRWVEHQRRLAAAAQAEALIRALAPLTEAFAEIARAARSMEGAFARIGQELQGLGRKR